ncbi:MAG TPA: protein kinase, partial [Candidatus Methylomirabilis sp.]
ELYRVSGRVREAMEICQLIGADAEYHALQAEQFASAGKAREAAEAWVQAGDPDRAAEYFRELGEWERAGDLLHSAGRLEAAAEMYEAGGRWAKAGAAYAEARRFHDAGRSYRQAGMAREAAAALAEGGDAYGAGVLLAEADAADEAIAMLQKLPPGAPDFAPAGLLLARLMLSRGLAQPALVRLQAIATHPGVAGRTAEVHYLLGRAYEETHRLEEALAQYERVLAERVDFEDVGARVAALRERTPSDPDTAGSTVVLGGPHGVPVRYRVTRELGRGGMGIVYEAQDQTLRRPVALKVPAPAIQTSAPARKRFLREARIAAGLRHRNIITVYDAGETAGGLYIAMELIQGVNLDAYLETRGPLPPAELLALGGQICAGLAHAHANGIVHADVKPANMLVDAEGTVHLTDFGLSRAWESTRTGTTEARGTPMYIAPEQIRGETLDVRTDIYGLGCTLYRMAAGAPPFTTGELLFRHLHEAPPRLRPMNPAVSEALEAVILKCLAKRPEDRFPSVDDVFRALSAAIPVEARSRAGVRRAEPGPAEPEPLEE